MKGIARKKGQNLYNPLYLKTKADEFVKNKDYYSAITAFTDISHADPDNMVAESNKIICNMKLFNYEETLRDCDLLIAKIEGLPEENRIDERSLLLLIRTKT